MRSLYGEDEIRPFLLKQYCVSANIKSITSKEGQALKIQIINHS